MTRAQSFYMYIVYLPSLFHGTCKFAYRVEPIYAFKCALCMQWSSISYVQKLKKIIFFQGLLNKRYNNIIWKKENSNCFIQFSKRKIIFKYDNLHGVVVDMGFSVLVLQEQNS